jgi:hypothetical protein
MRAIKCLAIIAVVITFILIPFVGFDAFTWWCGSLFVACVASGLDR